MGAIAANPITFETREITPSEAKTWLQSKRSDRRVSRAQIRPYAEDMRTGKWMMNGDPIIFGCSGALLSGVMRLTACVEADTAFPCLIVREIDDAHFETIDSVRRRTLADILTIRKEANGRVLAAALQVLYRYANDDYLSPRRQPSAHQVLSILETNPGIKDSLKLAADASRFMSPAVAGALHYLFSRADAVKADQFFDGLLDEEIDKGPVFLLRKQLADLKGTRGSKSQGVLIALAIKAWEAFAFGEDMKQLRFVPGNDRAPCVSNVDESSFRSGLTEDVGGKRTPTGSRKIALATLPQLEVEVADITPEMAEEMLQRNEANRGIAALAVEKYARDMSRGDWVLNGQTIKFGKSGRLLDGQHRLHASVLAGKTFPAIVVRGLEDAVFDTFDLGSKRAIGDILRDRGEVNTSTLGAALRQLWLLQHGLIQSRMAAPTVAELLEVLETNPDLRESVRLQHKIRDITAPTIMLALHYLFTHVNKEMANRFLDRLSDGAELTPRHPILTLRDQLMRARNERKVTLPDAERAAWTIKAWNAFLEDRKVATLKWQTVGPRKEPFPEIAGLPKLRRSLAA